MSILTSLYVAALFVALTPGVLLRIPKGGSKMAVAATHAVVFAVVIYFTYGYFGDLEGFAPRSGSGIPKPPKPAAAGSKPPKPPKPPAAAGSKPPKPPAAAGSKPPKPEKTAKGGKCVRWDECKSGICDNGLCQ